MQHRVPWMPSHGFPLTLLCAALLPAHQELERKSESANAERRKATDTILDLQRRLADAESTAQRLTAEHARLKDKLEAQRVAAEVRGRGAVGGGRGAAWSRSGAHGMLGRPAGRTLLHVPLRGRRTNACSELAGDAKPMQNASAKLRSAREEAAARQESYDKEASGGRGVCWRKGVARVGCDALKSSY